MVHNMFGYSWGMGWAWIPGIVVLLVLVWLAAGAVYRRDRTGEAGYKTAMDILKEQYARGKIDKKEFEEKKKDILS